MTDRPGIKRNNAVIRRVIEEQQAGASYISKCLFCRHFEEGRYEQEIPSVCTLHPLGAPALNGEQFPLKHGCHNFES